MKSREEGVKGRERGGVCVENRVGRKEEREGRREGGREGGQAEGREWVRREREACDSSKFLNYYVRYILLLKMKYSIMHTSYKVRFCITKKQGNI